MCGIAGAFGLGRPLAPEERQAAEAMTRILRHRGPDDIGFHEAPRAHLGNTRLAILDRSAAGHLPMGSADGRIWLAYNGEVTNFRELRDRHGLDQSYPLRSTSDSEVLVYLYAELGIDFVRELTGQFAFALCDAREEKAWLVRDPFGIRPLFYRRDRDRLYFASEIKSFLELPDFDASLDTEGLYHFFSLAYIPGEHTPFRQVRELQGGRLIELDLRAGGVSERSYYEPDYTPAPRMREDELVARLYTEMRDSVRRNLISDAPLGLTLSGGFDTSSILALARELVGEAPIHTFSIVMEEPSFDESVYQRLMVEAKNTVHHEVRVGPRQVEEALVEHMAYLDEPTGDGAAIPSYLLAKDASQYVSVLLSGEGGDETFNAYETHLANKARRLYRRLAPAPLRWLLRKGAHALPCSYDKLSFDFVAKRFVTGSEMSVPESHLYWRHVLTEADKRRLMPGLGHVPETHTLFTKSYEALSYEHELDRISVLDLKYYFIGDLMVKNDRTMMAHSIEARFPFMDRQLLDFVSHIPADQRLKGRTRRYLQKEAMKHIVPERIYRRQNMGLEMPHSIWFLGEMRPMAERYLAPDKVAATGVLDPGEVTRLWQEHKGRKRDHGRALWSVLNLVLWMDLFVHTRDYRRHLRPW